MPRRGSASAGIISNSSAASSTSRTHHKSHDSQHHVVGSQSLSSLGASVSPHQKIVQVLVNRLKNKLPCNSGMPLHVLEADDATQQAVEALVDLSRDSVDLIGWALTEQMDRLSKQTDSNGHYTLEVLQSQLFLLKVLSVAMASRWSLPRRSSSRASTTYAPGTDSPRPIRMASPSDTPSTPPPWSEPPPLDDNCAKYILIVMVLFLRQTASPEPSAMLPGRYSDITFRDYEAFDPATPMTALDGDVEDGYSSSTTTLPDVQPELKMRPSATSVRSGSSSSIPIMPGSTTYEKTHMLTIKSAYAVNELIAKFTGRIIFHISASNWSVVFARLRNKIRFLAGQAPDDTAPDTADLYILAHSVLDRVRLVQVLNELSSLLINFSLDNQKAVAPPLRTAIWNWIDYFPGEFNDALKVRGRLEGAPERIFDQIYGRVQPGLERDFWPLLNVLACISSDRISSEIQASGRAVKTVKFGEEILRHARAPNSKLGEVSLACALEMCRAATYIPAGHEVSLKLLAFDIAHEIKIALLNHPTRKSPWDATEDIDIPVYSEALVVLFRFLSEEESLPVFQICVEPERSEAVKTIAVRACLTLVQEASRFPWQRSLDSLETTLGPRFKDLFLTAGIGRAETDQFGNMKRLSPRPKALRINHQPLADREVLLLGILALWRISPPFFLKTLSPDLTNDWLTTSVKLWQAAVDPAVKISSSVTTRLTAGLAFLMSPTDPALPVMMQAISEGVSSCLSCVALNLLQARNDIEQQRLWTGVALQLLDLYVRKSEMEHVKLFQLNPRRTPGFILIEMAFVTTLPCVDTDISHLAAKGLRMISYAERQPGAPALPFSLEDLARRHPVYDQMGDPKVVIIGRLGYQKRIRKLLRILFSNSTEDGSASMIWQECYWRWRSLTELLTAVLEDTSDNVTIRRHGTAGTLEEWRHQWQNLTLFLSALMPGLDERIDFNCLVGIMPLELLPDDMRRHSNPASLLERMVDDLTLLLMHDDGFIRDVAKDALGGELTPTLYPSLLKKIDSIFQRLALEANTKGVPIFVDQFLSVMKLILDNPYIRLEEVMSIDVSNTLLNFASFISRFSNSDSFRLRGKFCSLCESVCTSTSTLTLRKDSIARHNILDIVVSWIEPSDHVGESARMQVELNLACLRTIVKLLDRLQLKPLDMATGDDSVHVISRLFNRYATTLLDGLELCQFDIPVSDSASDVGSIPQRMKLSQREAELRELVITGLSYLVSANSEIGFKQCLPLAYHEDSRKRMIFSYAFARVIGQGTKFDPAEKSSALSKHHRLNDLVKQPDMTLAIAVCEICPPTEVEAIIAVMLNLFDTRETLMALMKVMIEREVAQTENENALFRGNSFCTRFLSAFAKNHGYLYLRSLVIPLIKCIESMPSGYEMDPSKAPVGQDVEQNRRNIEFMTESFLEILASSSQVLPNMFREVSAHITKVVTEVWPSAKFSSLGAFMFLRFICPAIVSPDNIDIDVPNDAIRRGLMLIAKIIQNLANNVFFGKEAHMTALNDFLKAHITDITRYLTDLYQTFTEDDEEDHDEWVGSSPDATDVVVLHRFFHSHADKIGKELLSISRPLAEGDASAISGKRAWDGLCTLLVDLGPPLEVPRTSNLPRTEHEQYLSLMERFATRGPDPTQDFFIEVNVISDTNALFVFKFSKIDVEAIDIELMMYYILKAITASPRRGRFDLIVDCTGFVSNSELPLRWLKYCAEAIPSDIRQRFSRAFILNPNILTTKYLRRLYNVSGGSSYFDEVWPCSSISELVAALPEAEHAAHLLVEPIALEQDITETFADGTVKIERQRSPAVISIGTTHIRYTAIKRLSYSPTRGCKCTEIIPLTDINDVYKVNMSQDVTNEFVVRRNSTGSTTYFTSPSRDIIVKAIRTAKGRLKDARAPLAERFSRFSNVAATLLHVGLLNVLVNDEELRASAYHLLGAVCTYLNYDKNPIVIPKAGFVPGDLSLFANQFSQRIAEFAPHLTLDFISEVSAAMNAMEGRTADQIGPRIGSLQYLSPWIRNLASFCIPTNPLFERSGARVRDCIRVLCEHTIVSVELLPCIQQYVWCEVGKLDSIAVDVVLDELVRTATDAGIGTYRCEAIAFTIAAMSTISVRGRLVSRLRKAISKTSPSLTRSLVENPAWGEVSVLARLTLIAGYEPRYPNHNNLYVPEIIHVVTLIAGLGTTLTRKSVYGIVINLVQSLYLARLETSPAPELQQLLTIFTQPDTVKLFGIQRAAPSSEYSSFDPPNDKAILDNQEHLVHLLSRLLETSAGSNGLLNVWRARWTSLATASAFQYSSVIQMRSFTALGNLAFTDVDDDFMYQMMVAFKTALSLSNETDTVAVVSMLRCFTKIVPALGKGSRYLAHLFWLAVAFLQSSHFAFYIEATRLLCISLEEMERQDFFKHGSVSSVLLNSRLELEEVAVQLDHILGLSFDNNFSFSLAAVVFKGIRHAVLKDHAEKLLRTALKITVQSYHGTSELNGNGHSDSMSPDILGYFLALLPLSTTIKQYRQLLKEAGVHHLGVTGVGYEDESSVPRISLSLVGIQESTTALLTTSFIGAMLSTAQGDDAETEILYGVLSDISTAFPDIIAMAYESLQDRIRDCFANSTSSTVIFYASDILRVVSVHENTRFTSLRGSASTLNTMDDGSIHGPGGNHLSALEELGMGGIMNNFAFLPAQGGQATKVIQWIPGLVNLIIAS